MSQFNKVALVLTPQPEGGFTVTSPVIPELVTEGESVDEILENVKDALQAALETYEDLGKALPSNLRQDADLPHWLREASGTPSIFHRLALWEIVSSGAHSPAGPSAPALI